MRIAVDIREACRQKKAGKGQWTYGFVSELLKRNQEVILLTDSPIPEEWNSYSPDVVTLKLGWKWHFQAYRYLMNARIHFYVSPTSFIVPFLLRRTQNCVLVIHDMIAFMNEPHNKKAKYIERLLLKPVLKWSALVCTVSNATKADLMKHFLFLESDTISTIYAGPMTQQVPQNIPDHKTILSIGTLCPRKNQLRLIQAYDKLPTSVKKDYSLVLAGARGWEDEQIIQAIENTEGVIWKKYVDTNEYERLMGTCTIFAFPSMYEGFGMQVLDALQRGIPLLISDRGSLKEVASDAGFYVNPENVDDIKNGLELLLSDAAMQREMIESGKEKAKNFSWKITVDLFLSSLSDVLRRQ